MPDYKAFSDEKLLSLSALDRDQQAFEELLGRYEDKLWRFVKRRLRVTGEDKNNRSSRYLDAEEAKQEMWANLWELQHYLDNYQANAKAYIYKTARNLTASYWTTPEHHEELLKSGKAAKELFGGVRSEGSSFIQSAEDTFKELTATGERSVTTPIPTNISGPSASLDPSGEIGIDKTEDGEVVHVLIDTAPGPDASIEQRQSEKWVRFIECWEKLSEQKSAMIMMARLEGPLTYKEMAEALEEKFEAVKSRLRAAVKELNGCMGDLLTVTLQDSD